MNSYKSFGDLSGMMGSDVGSHNINFYEERQQIRSYVSTIYSTDMSNKEKEQSIHSEMCYWIKEHSIKNIKSKGRRRRDSIRMIKFLEKKSVSIQNGNKESRGKKSSAINKKIAWLRNLLSNQLKPTSAQHEESGAKRCYKSKSKFERDARRWNRFKKAKTMKDEVETDHVQVVEIPIHLQDEECVDISAFNENTTSDNSASKNSLSEKTGIVNRFYIGHKYMPIDVQVESLRNEVSEKDKDTVYQLKQEISVLFKELEEMIHKV